MPLSLDTEEQTALHQMMLSDLSAAHPAVSRDKKRFLGQFDYGWKVI